MSRFAFRLGEAAGKEAPLVKEAYVWILIVEKDTRVKSGRYRHTPCSISRVCLGRWEKCFLSHARSSNSGS